MTTPKPGEEITYMADIERTGVVLDRASLGRVLEWRDYWAEIPGFAVWVHREDGTFDKVKVVASGKRAGETTWLGHYTAGGAPIGVDLDESETA